MLIPLHPGQTELTPIQRLIAGGMAGTLALIITYPLDFVRTRLTVQTDSRYKGIIHATSTIIREEGIFTLYKGMWPSILGVVPYVGLDFAVYDTLRRKLPKNSDGTLNQLQTLACGAIAGTVGQTVAYPLDLIRRRLQVQGFISGTQKQQYFGVWDTLVRIVKTEGLVGLYRGLIPNYLKVIPSISMSFLIFENLKTVMHIKSSKV